MNQPKGAIQNRVDRIVAGNDPEFLCELPSGFAILGKFQPDAVRGACMLLPRDVVASPNDLDATARASFFSDLVLLGDAILEVTGAERINYLVLCNQVPELHGHAIPRFADEDPVKRMQGPFEAYDFGGARVADAEGHDRELFAALKRSLEARSAR